MPAPSQPLAPEEWDFESYRQNLKGNRLVFCHSYEFAREIPKIRDAYRLDREQYNNMKEGVWRVALVLKKLGQPRLRDCFPIPDFPYYDLADVDPGKRPEWDLKILCAPQEFPNKPFVLAHDIWDFFWPHLIPPRAGFSVVSLIKGKWVDTHKEITPNDELFHVRLRWEKSNDQIVQDFKEWLRDYQRPRPAVNRRGKEGERKLLVDLKALGAYRLLKRFKTVKAARAHCVLVKGTKYYKGDDDWRNAVERVDLIKKDFSTRCIESVPDSWSL
jgi:hypothetical protein